MVVAQLEEQSLPTPEVCGSNPVIRKLLYQTLNCLPTVNCIEKTKINQKRPRMAHLKKRFKGSLLGNIFPYDYLNQPSIELDPIARRKSHAVYLVTNGSPRQFRLCVVVKILFMFRWTYFRARSTRESILRNEAETRMETTFSGSK